MPPNLRVLRNLSCVRQPNTSSEINLKIKTLVQKGRYIDALQLYTKKTHSPLSTSRLTFPSLLKSCTVLSSIRHGGLIHGNIIKLGHQYDPYIATSLISMYVKCGFLRNAIQVFVKMSDRDELLQDVTLWNAMIDGYFRFGALKEGLDHVFQMQSEGVRPDPYTLSILLGTCDKLFSIYNKLGKQIHGYIVRNICCSDPFLDTSLIDMYSTCGLTGHAWNVFNRLEEKNNIVIWNAMISGFCANGLWESSLELFRLLKEETCGFMSSSFSGALTACSQGEDVALGRQIHSDVVKMGFEHDPFVCTSLLTMYSRCGFIELAEKVFHDIPDKKIELCNAIISCYVNNGCELEALDVFILMKRNNNLPDSFTISNVLSASCLSGLYDFGKMVHAELIKRPIQADISAQSALLTLYSKYGSTGDACVVFSMMEDKDVVAWGSVISGFCQSKKFEESLDLFRAMCADGLKPDADIMSSLFGACVGLDAIHMGCAIHGLIVKIGMDSDVFVGSSLIEMYSRGSLPEHAESIFSAMPCKSLVTWNSMISCYFRNGMPDKAVRLFPNIKHSGLYPDSISITSALVAVASTAVLLKGKIIHGYIIRHEIQSDVQVENTLIDMYIKCGCLPYASNIFRRMSRRNLVTWNSMIDGYGSHGECLEAIKLLHDMERSGTMPDGVTFLSLITSCSHSGFVDEGLEIFYYMKNDYLIEPKMEHCANVVDLLGRAGCLHEAYKFIEEMHIDPDQSIWQCLLSACRAARNVELGELAAKNLLKVEPCRSSNYVQLLNLYGEAGSLDRAASLRVSMKEMGLKKSPGYSWIEVRNMIHFFLAGDSSSNQTIEIYETLGGLRSNMETDNEFDDSPEYL